MATLTPSPRWRLYAVLLLFIVQLLTLFLLSRATENSEQFGQWQGWLLGVTSGGLLVLAALIGHSLYHLFTRLRRRVPGTRLTLRMVLIFLVISLVPVAVVYQFALGFLQRGIDSWFAVDIEEGLQNALQLSRVALDLPMRDALRQSHRVSELLQPPYDLEAALQDSGADELTVFRLDGGVAVTTAVAPDDQRWVDFPAAAAVEQVLRGQNYVALEPVVGGFAIRTLTALPQRQGLLQGQFPVPQQLMTLAQSVQQAHDGYRQRQFLRQPLKTSFSLTLSLVVLTSVLTACYAALYAAQRLVRPIRELAEGTRAVAAGRYERLVNLPQRRDELSFLVMSFNEMVQSLAVAREASARSQRQLERQRAYLETVLTQLSSGVLTLDGRGVVSGLNPAAEQLLGRSLAEVIGQTSTELSQQTPALAPFFQAVQVLATLDQEPLPSEGGLREVVLFGGAGRRILLLRSRALPASVVQLGIGATMGSDLGAMTANGTVASGTVIVFDEVTALVQAQRDAAWAEVARRLAHEIKNPLTPIQLSAERLRHKLLPQLQTEQQALLERTTHVIIQQVQALKDMVDDFNQYARPSRLHFHPIDGDELIREVADLFRESCRDQGIDLVLDLQAPPLEADANKLRQVLNNLVKNAVEAVQDGRGQRVTLRSRAYGAGVEWRITDDGPGFSPQLANPFEPYATTKAKGTGLGLAIVRKIVEEHGGVIELHRGSTPTADLAATASGAQVLLRLPCRSVPNRLNLNE